MKRGAVALILGLLSLAVVATGAVVWWQLRQPPVVEYEVVRGDTLFLIAKAHDVSVDELRAWNGLEGDLIEVGQVLRIHTTAPTADQPAPRTRRPVPSPTLRPEPEGTDRPELVMPPEKPCLDGPSLDGTADEAMAASQGLSHGQVSDAMSRFVGNVLPCMGEANPGRPLVLELTVACTGRVAEVAVLDRADWPPEVADCVVDVLGYTPFPAHDLPDGDSFQYPLRFSR